MVSQKLQLSLKAGGSDRLLTTDNVDEKMNNPKGLRSNPLTSFYLLSPKKALLLPPVSKEQP